ncbi:cation:H+ antiporter [Saccharicrinis carchari]|uniref:Cation:H+ antiporter n=1 Tax=Saccharicrinis carchari TaxID=1168039 RepID=A0A521DBQ8_SACCC|nr:calcium/sodium antiporter [Saccharicrinis carchari]SMO69157.1 cation:H+ antiporter [Saccharicrinis carchari]
MVLAGFVLLFFSGDWLVKASVQIARYFNISTLVVGLTVVAFGTSAPELIVSLKAVFDGVPDISVGNVIGSNVANIALVLGMVALILPIKVQKNSSVVFDWTVMMFVSLLFVVFAQNNVIEFYEGVIFVTIIVLYLTYSVYMSRRKMNKSDEVARKPSMKIYVAIGLLVLAGVGLYFGSALLVDGVVIVARSLNISERVIGISVVAFGTSVPELATSIMAAVKKETAISIGNIIGSNIFNLLAILGITSMLKPIGVSDLLIRVDVWWMIGVAVMLMLAMLPLHRSVIGRWKGAVLLGTYILYMVLLFIY